jgi:hypothetical protein
MKHLGLALLTSSLLAAGAATASSHREAPAISKDPFADNTDTYVFVPPSNTNNLVLAASWIPFEGPEGGPNYFEWDDSAVYEIYVDNNGDAVADFTYRLTSNTTIADSAVTGRPSFLYNDGALETLGDSNLLRRQTITIEEISASGTVTLVSGAPALPVNIGSKSNPDYDKLVAESIRTFGSGDAAVKTFAGPADDAFFVDLQVFDLLTLRGQNAPIGYSSGDDTPNDSVSGYNAHSLVIELPISRVTRALDFNDPDDEGEPVLGVWSATTRNDVNGTPVQVSRLGMPLVNEVVIPMSLKDTFNSLSPDQDLNVFGLLQNSVENPEVGVLLCALYGVPMPGDSNDDCNTEFNSVNTGGLAAARSGRGDIFDIYLTGMELAAPFTIQTANGPLELPAGFNINRPANVRPAEMIRINTTIIGDLCSPTPSPLGVLGGDACGFPNGRRFTDDAVDISLLAVGGAAYAALDGRDTTYSFNSGLIGVLSDNVNENDQPFSTSFPYLAPAQSGQEHVHQNPLVALIANYGGGGSLGLLALGLLALMTFVAPRIRSRKEA